VTSVELEPAHLSTWDLRVHLACERAGGWEPTHFTPPGADEPVCQTYQGRDVGDTYGLTSDRRIWEEWHRVGWGCPWCAEVLHS
jgi:hypothetical protein